MFGLRLCNFILPNYILWFAKNEIICTNHKKYSKKNSEQLLLLNPSVQLPF